MDRRELLGAAGVAGVGLVTAGIANARPKESTLKSTHSDLVASSTACVAAGEVCLDHCVELLSGGDTSLAECATRVKDMLAVCRGLTTLAAADSEFLASYAAVCAQICRACQDACSAHRHHHEECAACYDACEECATLCEAV